MRAKTSPLSPDSPPGRACRWRRRKRDRERKRTFLARSGKRISRIPSRHSASQTSTPVLFNPRRCVIVSARSERQCHNKRFHSNSAEKELKGISAQRCVAGDGTESLHLALQAKPPEVSSHPVINSTSIYYAERSSSPAAARLAATIAMHQIHIATLRPPETLTGPTSQDDAPRLSVLPLRKRRAAPIRSMFPHDSPLRLSHAWSQIDRNTHAHSLAPFFLSLC